MIDVLPVAPQLGLSLHWYLFAVLAIGVLFGFALERAGFGSAKNLTAIFILRDFRVFRVMFSAVLTSMLGAHLLHFLGLINLSLIPFAPTIFWSIVVGGLVFGVGFYLGGFCPGTAVVAMARGRLDGLAFLFGIVIGIWGFAELYDVVGSAEWFSNFYAPADAAQSTLYGDGVAWPWIVGIAAAAFMGFAITPIVEKKFGLRTVEELKTGKRKESPSEPKTTTKGPAWRMAVLPAVGAVLVAIIVAEWRMPHPELTRDRPRLAPVVAGEDTGLLISAQTLAGWLLEDAHRRAEGEPKYLLLFDLRDPRSREELTIPYSRAIETEASGEKALTVRVLRELREAQKQRSAPLVLVGEDVETMERLAMELRRRHIPAMVLDGGSTAWKREVLGWEPNGVGASEETGEILAKVWHQARSWLAKESQELPPRFVFPGATPPRTAVATVVATGTGAGGGCN